MVKVFRRSLGAFLAGFVGYSAQATVLVDEGFVIGGEGGYSETDKTSCSSKDGQTGLTASTGFVEDHWDGTTGVIVSRKDGLGLAFPSNFAGKMEPSGAGSIGFRMESSSANWNDATKSSQANTYRNQYRKINSINGAPGEKRYFRALICANPTAMTQLYQKDTWLSWRNAYNVGLVTLKTGMDYSTAVMDCPRYIHFSCYRNTSGSTAVNEIAVVVKGKEGVAKRQKLCTMASETRTYLCVAEITLGDGPDTFRVFAHDCSQPLDMDNLPWVEHKFEGTTFDLIDSSDDLNLFVGGSYMTTGSVRFDEMRVGTTLNDVIPAVDKYVSVASMSVGERTGNSATLAATLELKGVSSAVPTLRYGLSPTELTESKTLAPVTADGEVTTVLTGLDPITTYYYQWTLSADGAEDAEGPVASFDTKGGVVFGAVTLGGLPSTGGTTATVALEEAGLGATTVECWCGTSEETMTLLQTWENVTAGTELTATHAEAAYGTTECFQFKASFAYEGKDYAYETAVNRLTLAGTDTWAGAESSAATEGTFWTTGVNWDLLAVPTANLDVVFSKKNNYAAAGEENLAAKTLKVKSNANAVLDFAKETTLAVGSIDIGDTANATVGSLAITNGTITVSGAVHVPTDKLKASYNGLTLSGTTMNVTGAFAVNPNTDGAQGNYASFYDGSMVTVGSVDVSRKSTLTVAGGSSLTNNGELRVGNLGDGTVTIRDNSTFTQNGSTVNIAYKGVGALNVLRGSSFLAGSKTVNLGGGSDGGYNGTLTISNALFRAGTLNAPVDSRYTKDYVINVRGETGKLELSGNLNVCSPTRNYREAGSSTLSVEGGEVAVGGTIAFGSSADKRKNYFNLSGATAKVRAASLSCATNAVITITVPERGFANTLVETTGNIAFSSNDAIKTPITIDATACKSGAWQTLFASTGGEIKNYSEGVITVSGTYKNNKSDLRVVTNDEGKVTAVRFRVQNAGLMIVIR